MVLIPFALASTILPAIVLFQRLAPEGVEATMMSFSMTVINSSGLLGTLSGYLLNKYVLGVTRENIETYYKIQYISILCALSELLYIKLIPIRSDIEGIIVKNKFSKVEEEEVIEKEAI
jgi:hypothetical protein